MRRLDISAGLAGSAVRWLTLAVLVVDAVILAVLEIFFLPLRFDGQLLPDLGSWPFPITVLLAAVSTPWLVARAGDLSDRLLVVGAPLWAWLATVAVLGFFGPENNILPQDWRTLLLLAATTLPTAIVLGNVLGTRRRKADAAKPATAASSGSGGARRSRAGHTG
jgi:hypothetical protein